jgi:hypothetical protein
MEMGTYLANDTKAWLPSEGTKNFHEKKPSS